MPKSALRRTQSLYETGNASKGQLDTAMAAEKTAQAALTTAEKRVKDCVLLMPYDGVVGKVSVREQESVSSGKAVLTLLADGGGFEFSVGVPGEWIGRVKPGMKGAVVVRALGEKSYEAEVSEVGAEPESNSTYPVLLQLSGDGKDLREGMDGEAILSFVSGRSGGVAIPLSCVASLPGDIAYVYLLTPNEAGTEATLSRQEVKVGAVLEAGRVEIVSGLTPGSLVVSRGVHRLQPETVVALRSDLIEK